MTSTGKTGVGVVFQISLSLSPAVWTTLGNVKSINFNGRAADDIDFTNLNSDQGYREMRQGFKDGGSVAVDVQFDPTDTTHVGSTKGLLGLFNSGDVFYWRINFFPNGWSWAIRGQGYVQNPGDIDINVDGPIMGTASIRVTGPSSRVAAASLTT